MTFKFKNLTLIDQLSSAHNLSLVFFEPKRQDMPILALLVIFYLALPFHYLKAQQPTPLEGPFVELAEKLEASEGQVLESSQIQEIEALFDQATMGLEGTSNKAVSLLRLEFYYCHPEVRLESPSQASLWVLQQKNQFAAEPFAAGSGQSFNSEFYLLALRQWELATERNRALLNSPEGQAMMREFLSPLQSGVNLSSWSSDQSLVFQSVWESYPNKEVVDQHLDSFIFFMQNRTQLYFLDFLSQNPINNAPYGIRIGQLMRWLHPLLEAKQSLFGNPSQEAIQLGHLRELSIIRTIHLDQDILAHLPNLDTADQFQSLDQQVPDQLRQELLETNPQSNTLSSSASLLQDTATSANLTGPTSIFEQVPQLKEQDKQRWGQEQNALLENQALDQQQTLVEQIRAQTMDLSNQDAGQLLEDISERESSAAQVSIGSPSEAVGKEEVAPSEQVQTTLNVIASYEPLTDTDQANLESTLYFRQRSLVLAESSGFSPVNQIEDPKGNSFDATIQMIVPQYQQGSLFLTSEGQLDLTHPIAGLTYQNSDGRYLVDHNGPLSYQINTSVHYTPAELERYENFLAQNRSSYWSLGGASKEMVPSPIREDIENIFNSNLTSQEKMNQLATRVNLLISYDSRESEDQALDIFNRCSSTHHFIEELFSRVKIENGKVIQKPTSSCGTYANLYLYLIRLFGSEENTILATRLSRGYMAEKGIITSADAHAWVEVYIQGQGWKKIDPTNIVRSAGDEGMDQKQIEAEALRAGLGQVGQRQSHVLPNPQTPDWATPQNETSSTGLSLFEQIFMEQQENLNHQDNQTLNQNDISRNYEETVEYEKRMETLMQQVSSWEELLANEQLLQAIAQQKHYPGSFVYWMQTTQKKDFPLSHQNNPQILEETLVNALKLLNSVYPHSKPGSVYASLIHKSHYEMFSKGVPIDSIQLIWERYWDPHFRLRSAEHFITMRGGAYDFAADLLAKSALNDASELHQSPSFAARKFTLKKSHDDIALLLSHQNEIVSASKQGLLVHGSLYDLGNRVQHFLRRVTDELNLLPVTSPDREELLEYLHDALFLQISFSLLEKYPIDTDRGFSNFAIKDYFSFLAQGHQESQFENFLSQVIIHQNRYFFDFLQLDELSDLSIEQNIRFKNVLLEKLIRNQNPLDPGENANEIEKNRLYLLGYVLGHPLQYRLTVDETKEFFSYYWKIFTDHDATNTSRYSDDPNERFSIAGLDLYAQALGAEQFKNWLFEPIQNNQIKSNLDLLLEDALTTYDLSQLTQTPTLHMALTRFFESDPGKYWIQNRLAQAKNNVSVDFRRNTVHFLCHFAPRNYPIPGPIFLEILQDALEFKFNFVDSSNNSLNFSHLHNQSAASLMLAPLPLDRLQLNFSDPIRKIQILNNTLARYNNFLLNYKNHFIEQEPPHSGLKNPMLELPEVVSEDNLNAYASYWNLIHISDYEPRPGTSPSLILTEKIGLLYNLINTLYLLEETSFIHVDQSLELRLELIRRLKNKIKELLVAWLPQDEFAQQLLLQWNYTRGREKYFRFGPSGTGFDTSLTQRDWSFDSSGMNFIYELFFQHAPEPNIQFLKQKLKEAISGSQGVMEGPWFGLIHLASLADQNDDVTWSFIEERYRELNLDGRTRLLKELANAKPFEHFPERLKEIIFTTNLPGPAFMPSPSVSNDSLSRYFSTILLREGNEAQIRAQSSDINSNGPGDLRLQMTLMQEEEWKLTPARLIYLTADENTLNELSRQFAQSDANLPLRPNHPFFPQFHDEGPVRAQNIVHENFDASYYFPLDLRHIYLREDSLAPAEIYSPRYNPLPADEIRRNGSKMIITRNYLNDYPQLKEFLYTFFDQALQEWNQVQYVSFLANPYNQRALTLMAQYLIQRRWYEPPPGSLGLLAPGVQKLLKEVLNTLDSQDPYQLWLWKSVYLAHQVELLSLPDWEEDQLNILNEWRLKSWPSLLEKSPTTDISQVMELIGGLEQSNIAYRYIAGQDIRLQVLSHPENPHIQAIALLGLESLLQNLSHDINVQQDPLMDGDVSTLYFSHFQHLRSLRNDLQLNVLLPQINQILEAPATNLNETLYHLRLLQAMANLILDKTNHESIQDMPPNERSELAHRLTDFLERALALTRNSSQAQAVVIPIYPLLQGRILNLDSSGPIWQRLKVLQNQVLEENHTLENINDLEHERSQEAIRLAFTETNGDQLQLDGQKDFLIAFAQDVYQKGSPEVRRKFQQTFRELTDHPHQNYSENLLENMLLVLELFSQLEHSDDPEEVTFFNEMAQKSQAWAQLAQGHTQGLFSAEELRLFSLYANFNYFHFLLSQNQNLEDSKDIFSNIKNELLNFDQTNLENFTSENLQNWNQSKKQVLIQTLHHWLNQYLIRTILNQLKNPPSIPTFQANALDELEQKIDQYCQPPLVQEGLALLSDHNKELVQRFLSAITLAEQQNNTPYSQADWDFFTQQNLVHPQLPEGINEQQSYRFYLMWNNYQKFVELKNNGLAAEMTKIASNLSFLLEKVQISPDELVILKLMQLALQSHP